MTTANNLDCMLDCAAEALGRVLCHLAADTLYHPAAADYLNQMLDQRAMIVPDWMSNHPLPATPESSSQSER